MIHKKRLPYICYLIVVCCAIHACRSIRSTGKLPEGAQLDSIKKLPNYSPAGFINLDRDSSGGSINVFRVLRDQHNKPSTTRPPAPLQVVKTDLVHTTYEKPTVIWFGHSGVLVKTKTANILIDPNLNNFAGPFSWLMKAFDAGYTYQPADMPAIDVLLISHDHYDHLDYNTITQLKSKVKKVIVPVGIGSHLRYWGYDNQQIQELNWGDELQVNAAVTITATPSRHTSGRLFSRDKTLWASYVIDADGYMLFYSGDTGYGSHFKQIGELFGPFDLALMECGQYGRNWSHNHMFPEQTAQAAADLRAKMILPVHWGKFAEAHHPWNESVTRMKPVADSLHIPVTIPKIGEPYTIGTPAVDTGWWH